MIVLCIIMNIISINFLNRRGEIAFCKGLYSTVQNTRLIHYRDQKFISVLGNRQCLFSEIYKLKKIQSLINAGVLILQLLVCTLITII